MGNGARVHHKLSGIFKLISLFLCFETGLLSDFIISVLDPFSTLRMPCHPWNWQSQIKYLFFSAFFQLSQCCLTHRNVSFTWGTDLNCWLPACCGGGRNTATEQLGHSPALTAPWGFVVCYLLMYIWHHC